MYLAGTAAHGGADDPCAAMPCATIHMLTAGRLLRHWGADPDRAPFPVHEPSLRRAFLLGSMGPDMGFVPGVDRLVSELSHYVRTGDLVQAILREARDAEQEAYAWGWAAHHQTDAEIHPLVGRACGEHLHGDRDLRLNSSDDLYTHVALEVGLDLVFLVDDPSIPRPVSAPVLGAGRLDFLRRALAWIYQIPFDAAALRSSHRTATLRTARWPRALRLLAAGRGFGTPPDRLSAPRYARRALAWLLDAAGSVVDPDGAPAGFLRPLSPPGWMIHEVEEIAGSFPDRFQCHVESRLEGLENRNLETGLAEDAPVDHPDSAATRRRLHRLRSDAAEHEALPS